MLIGSVSGSWPDRSGAAYQASKAAMHAFARGAAFEEEHGRALHHDHARPRRHARSSTSAREPPGAELRAQMLQPEDVAAACLFAVSLPPRAHVAELTILPTGLQALGRTA